MKQCLCMLFLFALPVFSTAQRCNETVRINPEEAPFLPKKPGYKLFLQDEFDGETIDTIRWNISCDGDEKNGCFRDMMYNPDHPYLENGAAVLPLTADSLLGCPMSGSELKTFSTLKGFRNYRFYPGTYVEIRAKLVKGANAGCAGWLYFNWMEGNQYREVDIWETRPTSPDRFQSNYHLKPGGGKAWWVCLRDLEGNPVDVSETYITYGFEWQPGNLRFYVNNILVREVKLKRKEKFEHPMALRLTSGTAPLDPGPPRVSELPVSSSIDYVRVYVPDATPVIKLLAMPNVVKHGEGTGIRWASFPGVTSVLKTPAGFKTERIAKDADDFWWVTAGNEVEPDKWHELTIEVSCETGLQEYLIYPIYVQKNRPPGELFLPTKLFVTKTP